MSTSPPTVADEVERYLRTGETDPYLAAWPGGVIESARRAHANLRGALVREVRRLAEGLSHEPVPDGIGVDFTRSKVEAMVRGLFPRAEQDTVLATLEKSVVYVTSASIEAILRENPYDSSAWDLANLYLGSLGAELLGADAPRIVGFSESTTCYVSPDYFVEDDPFADFIVHEAAHILHNCKRRTLGLRETRSKEWLLQIEYRKRESLTHHGMSRASDPQALRAAPEATKGTSAAARVGDHQASVSERWS